MGKANTDIRKKKQGVPKLGLHEENLTLLHIAVESAGIGTWVFDLAGNKKYFDKKASELLGFKTTEYIEYKRSETEFLELIHSDDRETVRKQLIESEYRKSEIETDFRVVWSDGSVRYMTTRARLITDNNGIPIRLIGLIWDISDRKKVEEELKSSLEQLHQVAQHIEEVREEERVAISRELHDDLGQALTAVKIDLASIKQNVTDMATVLKINKVSALVGDTIKTVQRLTSQLRPQIIDDLGLETAIEWYTKEFEERNKIKIYLDLNPDLVIAPDVSLVLFRIMQEAFTNIARYSGATTAKIVLGKRGGNIEFSVSDNGTGLSDDKISSKKSFGIISMRERAASLGGTLKIFREDERFTVIHVVFPNNKNVSNENSDM
jgi:two-component system sensor histidine kinase UhpB